MRKPLRNTGNGKTEITLGFYCCGGFSLDGLSMALEFFEVANMHAINNMFVCNSISVIGGEVISSCGIPVETNPHGYADEDFDYLFILSGPNKLSPDQNGLPGIVRSHIKRGSVVGSLNGGVFALADTGVLGGGPCSVSITQRAAFSELFPEIKITEEKLHINNYIWSVTSGAPCLKLFNFLLSHHESRVVCSKLSDQFDCEQDRDCNCGAGSKTGDGWASGSRAVDQAIQLFRDNIEETICLVEVARHTGLSLRQLERKFLKFTKVTPIQFYKYERLLRAREIVLSTDLPFLEIAVATGFSSSSQMAASYRKRYGCTPNYDRANHA